jgi:hypothetical protein
MFEAVPSEGGSGRGLRYDHTAMPADRVTVTLPPELLRDVDRRATNRSKFIQEAVSHELLRLRRQDLERSLASPHPESEEVAETGIAEWASRLPEDEAADLVDLDRGTEIRWTPGKGWTEGGP